MMNIEKRTIIKPSKVVKEDLMNLEVGVKELTNDSLFKVSFSKLSEELQNFLTDKLKEHFLNCDVDDNENIRITTLYVLERNGLFERFINIGLFRA